MDILCFHLTCFLCLCIWCETCLLLHIVKRILFYWLSCIVYATCEVLRRQRPVNSSWSAKGGKPVKFLWGRKKIINTVQEVVVFHNWLWESCLEKLTVLSFPEINKEHLELDCVCYFAFCQVMTNMMWWLIPIPGLFLCFWKNELANIKSVLKLQINVW